MNRDEPTQPVREDVYTTQEPASPESCRDVPGELPRDGQRLVPRGWLPGPVVLIA